MSFLLRICAHLDHTMWNKTENAFKNSQIDKIDYFWLIINVWNYFCFKFGYCELRFDSFYLKFACFTWNLTTFICNWTILAWKFKRKQNSWKQQNCSIQAADSVIMIIISHLLHWKKWLLDPEAAARLQVRRRTSAKVGKDDNFESGSPAALWSCLIVFLVDPPPENFEQLTSENIYCRTDGFFHFSASAAFKAHHLQRE